MRNAEKNIKFTKVTPRMAKELLQQNTNNRPVRKSNLEALTRDMVEGRYQFNGDAIRISTDNVLLDGQHRLMAIVESGVTQDMLVITNLPPETMKTIDAGVKRTNGDRLSLSGYKWGNNLSAVLNLMHGMAYGLEKRNLTSTETYEAIERHVGLEHSIAITSSCPVGGKSYIAALHYIGTFTGHANLADEFAEVFKTGHSANPNHPARVARERILRMKAEKKAVNRAEQMEILTAAWEHMRNGKSVQKIVVRNGENRVRMHGWDGEQFWGYNKK